jgi:iron complex outermembrane receptor protein
VSYQVNDLLGFFADLQYRFIDWKLEGTEDAYGDISQSHLFSFINPKAGINYHINQRNESYFSFAVANREPSRQNYIDASDDPVKPTSETLYDFELGYAYKAPKTALMVNAFYMKYVDQLVATGELDNVGYAILRNVPDSYRLGMELSFGLKILDNLSWTIYGTVSSNKIKDFEEYVDDFDTGGKRTNLYNSTDISFSPGLTAGSDLIYKPFDGFDVSLVSSYVSRQYIDNTNSLERSIDPYFVNNLRFNYEISMNIIDRLALHFEIINLFNEIYESNAWTYRYILGGEYQYSSAYFPQAGIHFMGGITLNF